MTDRVRSRPMVRVLVGSAMLLCGMAVGTGGDRLWAQDKDKDPGSDKVAPRPSGPGEAKPEPKLPQVIITGSGRQSQITPALGFLSVPQFNFTIDPKTPLKDLLPTPPKSAPSGGPLLTDDLNSVPEVAFQAPLPKDGTAMRETAHQMAKINHLNNKKHDAFMEALFAERPDLSGLPVAMGDACRTKGEQARQFTTAVNTVRQALQPLVDMKSIEIKGDVKNAKEVVFQTTTPATAAAFWERYQAACAQEDKAAPPGDRTRAECVTRARIAALMQMLAAEAPAMRLGLAKYLSGVAHADATKALARLAIFAAEDDIRQAALDALKVRRERDYTDIVLQGLRYPLPIIAKRASEALVKLERTDLLGQLVDLLDEADPRAPNTKKVQGKE
ncbi:MAG TPA: HEAT repeat domain-containing protein, partial [Gemmataceae bacterium]|nr:HEAT repeat domain-containing protein [Gemmataceae bacterium]